MISNGRHLLLITFSEHEFRYFFIGGTDETQEGIYVSTVTGERLTYFNWLGGEPNNYDEAEHCIEIDVSKSGGWNDIFCNFVRSFVCDLPRKCGDVRLSYTYHTTHFSYGAT